MNFELSDEQALLRDAARDALSRIDTVAAARQALDGATLPDLWPTAVAAGWPGLMVGEERGGAGLGAFEGMLVMWECGRALSPALLFGHLLGTAVLEAAAASSEVPELAALAAGDARVAVVASQPPADLIDRWTADPRSGARRAAPPAAVLDGDAAILSGHASFIPDAVGADLFLTVALDAVSNPVAVLLERSAIEVEPVERFDATRLLGHVRFADSRGRVLAASSSDLESAWYLGQALIAAESLGSVEAALEMAVAYAKDRHTFGRAIGSYQAIKHMLVEVVRLLENARSVMYYAGWAYASRPDEFPLAASAARVAAAKAFDFTARALIAVHGGIGATWEHDAHLYFRRAQLSRRLFGGTAGCGDRVAGELIARTASVHAA